MGLDEDILGLNSVMEVPLDVKYGTKTLTADAIKRLQDVEKLTMSTITLIDKRWKDGDSNNFANPDEPMSEAEFEAKTRNRGKYALMLKECYPSVYMKSSYYKNTLIELYGSELGDTSAWSHVPTLEDFYRINTVKPYASKDSDGKLQLTGTGKSTLEKMYKQYLENAWPNYWKGKIYSDLSEVDPDNLQYNMLCPYTADLISRDAFNGPCGKEPTEAELKALVGDLSSLVKKPSLDQVAELIDKLNELQGSNTLTTVVKRFINQQKTKIISNLVWSKVSPTLLPKSDFNPNGIDYKNLSKDDFDRVMSNLKVQVMNVANNIAKDVEAAAKELYTTAKGVYDNIIAIPKTLSMMITAASIPQVIPTTGGIPNIARILLDIMNIVDSVLALVPPIIEGLAKMLGILKQLMIPPSELPMIGGIIDKIQKLKEACAAAKEKNKENLQKARDQIDKMRTKLQTLKSKRDRTDDEEKKADLQEEIDALEQQITDSENAITAFETRNSESESEGQYENDEALNGSLDTIGKTLDGLLKITDNINTITVDAVEVRVPIDSIITMLENQDSRNTPFCGRIYQRI